MIQYNTRLHDSADNTVSHKFTASRKKCYPVEIMFIMEAHPWLCPVGFFHRKILLETSTLRVKSPSRAWGEVFKVQGPVTTYIEVREGGGGQIWLFSLCGCQITEPFLIHC